MVRKIPILKQILKQA